MNFVAELAHEQLVVVIVLTRLWHAGSVLLLPTLQLLALPDLYPARVVAFEGQVASGVAQVGSTYKPVKGLSLTQITRSFPALLENCRGVTMLGLFCRIAVAFTPS